MKSVRVGTWLLLLALTCCDGRGCDAFTGCGFAPLQNPFPSTERISNAAQVRLTEAGLGFIGANASTLPEVIPAAGLEVAIPRVTRTVDIPVIGSTDFTLCGNDDCTVRVSSMATNVRATPPNAVTLGADVSVVGLPNATNEARFPIRIRGGCSFLGCVINTTCQAALDTGPGTRSFIGIDASSSLLEESEAARSGYTYVSDPSTGVRSATGFETTDVVITDCEGVSGAIFEEIERTVTSTASTAVLAALAPRFTDAVDAELCTLAGSTGCPNGTIADGDGEDAVCRYADDRCAHYLGSDGRADLGALPLGAVTPAGVAPLQYVLASGGEGEAVNDGLSFFLHGGVLSMSADFQTTPGRNTCVPTVAAPTTPTVERAALFRDDAIPGTDDEAHLAYGISEALLDHAGYAMFDSGLLCLDPGSALGAPIQTGLVSIIASAVDALDYDDARMQLGVGLRPQQPADFSLGATDGDATLTATLPGAELELYVLSDAEPTRLLTLLTDLTLAFDLVPDAGDVGLVLRSVTAGRPSVSNADGLDETDAELTRILAGTIEAIVRDRVGALPAVGLHRFFGFDAEVTRVQPVSEGEAHFLGVYADLAVPPTAPVPSEDADTVLSLGVVSLDATSMAAETFGEGERSTVAITMSATGPDAATFEFSHRVDGGPWSAWTDETMVDVDATSLWLQGRHTIEARARVSGRPDTIDLTPASQELLIDVLAPAVTLTQADGTLTATALDIVSLPDTLEYRFSVNGEFGDWSTESTASAPATDDEDRIVEVRDEAGNIGRATIAGTPVMADAGMPAEDAGPGSADDAGAMSPDAGRADAGVPSARGGGGCGCQAAGVPAIPTRVPALLVLALVLLGFWRRNVVRQT